LPDAVFVLILRFGVYTYLYVIGAEPGFTPLGREAVNQNAQSFVPMVRLQQSELAAFSKALALLYAEASLSSLAARVTACLHALFGCDVASFDLFDESALRWSTVVVSPAIPNWDCAVAVLQNHAHEHPIVTNAARNDFPHAIRTSDLRSLREYRQTGLYQDFFRVHLMKTDRQLGFVAKPSPMLTIGASVNRRGRDFSVEQCALMEHLRPHLLQAYLTAQSWSQVPVKIQAERDCASTLAGGELCQIDQSGKIEWMTGGVEGILARFFGREPRGRDRLPGSLFERIRRVIQVGDGTINKQLRSWEYVRENATLRVQIAAHLGENSWQVLLTEECQEKSAELLANQHGLSKREGEVLLWMSQGKTNAEIALILELAARTVEKHVENLFSKLGVYNRTAATRMALNRSSD
jgi:DNA-binding CsgD family transcriptional regulator